MNKPMRSIAIAILTTMFSGLILFFFDFHYSQYPETRAEVMVMQSRLESQKDYLERIDQRTQKIYEILLDKK